MLNRLLPALVALVLLLPAEAVDFNRDIRPILSKNCLACHGPDEESRKGDLRLDTFGGATENEAVIPGKAAESELIFRIESDDPDEVMPPPDSGHALTSEDAAMLKEWIQEGAVYAEHWAFVKPEKKPLPAVADPAKGDWARQPWDRFVLARLEAEDLAPTVDLDPVRLLRRLSLAITGLPPTAEDADAFAKTGASEGAVEAAVDRLLASEAFGEHWAAMWLDLARYADTKGYEKDKHRDIWPYRDWVIHALNADMPYDQFSIEQLAGDLLPDATEQQILATAFHRNTMTNEEGGTDNEEFRIAAVKDRVDTTMQVWMGLTMGCAKCHTHKYDPISIDDYYSFYAFFNQTQDKDQEHPLRRIQTPALAVEIKAAEQEVERLSAELATETPVEVGEAFTKWVAEKPGWRTLRFDELGSIKGTAVDVRADGVIVGKGTRPERDIWTFRFPEPGGVAWSSVKSLRIEHFPQSAVGGEWPDANVALRELTATWITPDGNRTPVELSNPRASFSQGGWPVAKAIDGDAGRGWALSPKFKEAHVAVFDFAKPLPEAGRLELVLEMQYGDHLLLARSRFSVSADDPKTLTPKVGPTLDARFLREVHPPTKAAYAKVDAARKALDKTRKAIPLTPVMLEEAPNRQRVTKIHQRGNFLDQGAVVGARVPTHFGALPADAPTNRLGVATWLMSEENPLTSRVMVNRVWARLFGVGLVETEEDFGSQGLMPSHPDLLDWLAVDFREQGWSLKQLVRTLVLSRTFRQAAAADEENRAKDPRNRLLSRGPRFRLSAEATRDQALAVSGLLTRKVGGPSVMPPQPPGLWQTTYSGEDWKNAEGPDRYRRGIYTYKKRTSPHPFMTIFDAGTGETCLIRRTRTNTPLHALATMNDPAMNEPAGGLARRIAAVEGDVAEKLHAGFRMVLMRPPTEKELQVLVEYYGHLPGDTLDPVALQTETRAKDVDVRWIVIAMTLLNLDETVNLP